MTQTLQEAFEDPDQGVELHLEMEQAIQQSLANAKAEGCMVAAEDVAARLGLDW